MAAGDDLFAETVSGARAGVVSSEGAWRLRIVAPREVATTVALTEPTVVGRAPAAAGLASVAHRTVSRAHLQLERVAGVLTARDLGSHNGSWVDGVRLEARAVPLHDGAVVRLGDVLAVVEYEPRVEPGDDAVVARDAVPGDAPAVVALRRRLAAVAVDPAPVLVIGETGTGKELVAHELHRLSQRRGPLVAFNCAELAPTVVESQLFGHDKGAFTGASGSHRGLFREADGGTLFLDEIGELLPELQPKLLRVIQTGQVHAVGAAKPVAVDVRIVAATNRELQAEVERGGFRRDLHARLALHELRVPPLRERRGDLLAWIDLLAQLWSERRERAVVPFDLRADAAELLLRAPWLGNLRELDRLVHALAPGYDGGAVGPAQLPAWLREGDDAGSTVAETEDEAQLPPLPTQRGIPSREALLAALEQHQWVVIAVARHFGRDRRQVYRWMDGYGIRREP
ncbi:MAG: sigma 54-interacting transcriptional regulator [Nannocystaceae bacterium]|nr:sigma 54-interacting transcriptional regulator [Nannocystaceae bacterium]